MKDAWLDPNGKIIEVGDNMHNEYASSLLEEEMGSCRALYDYLEENNLNYPYEVLHQRGWIRVKYNSSYLPRIEILGNCISLVSPMRNTMEPAMNDQQIRVAMELCEKCNTPLHIAINDKRFW